MLQNGRLLNRKFASPVAKLHLLLHLEIQGHFYQSAVATKQFIYVYLCEPRTSKCTKRFKA